MPDDESSSYRSDRLSTGGLSSPEPSMWITPNILTFCSGTAALLTWLQPKLLGQVQRKVGKDGIEAELRGLGPVRRFIAGSERAREECALAGGVDALHVGRR